MCVRAAVMGDSASNLLALIPACVCPALSMWSVLFPRCVSAIWSGLAPIALFGSVMERGSNMQTTGIVDVRLGGRVCSAGQICAPMVELVTAFV